MTADTLFSCPREPPGGLAAQLWLLEISASSVSRPAELTGITLPELKFDKVSSTHAATGASEPNAHASFGASLIGAANSFRLSPDDGRRGRHERNWFSSESVSFINDSFLRRARAHQRVGGQF